jgi:hypothetical protein
MQNGSPGASDKSWIAQSLALFFPFTAMLHHAIFFRPTCMLNPVGLEYDGPTIGRMLTRDPSIWIAFAAAVSVCLIGLRFRSAAFRGWVPAFLIAFLPLTLWIWDIPLMNRPICRWGHDGHIVLPLIGPFHTRYLYMFGTLVFVGILLVRARIPGRTRRIAA